MTYVEKWPQLGLVEGLNNYTKPFFIFYLRYKIKIVEMAKKAVAHSQHGIWYASMQAS
jgi:hypothetical protein